MGEVDRLQIVEATDTGHSLDCVSRQVVAHGPIRCQHHAGDMPARGMTGNHDPVAVVTVRRSLFPQVCDGSLTLVGQLGQCHARTQGIFDVGESDRGPMATNVRKADEEE